MNELQCHENNLLEIQTRLRCYLLTKNPVYSQELKGCKIREKCTGISGSICYWIKRINGSDGC